MVIRGLKQWMIVPIMILVWLLSLVYGSGIGQAYDVYGKAKLLVLALAAYQLLIRRRVRYVKKDIFLVIAYLFFSTLITSVLYAHNTLDFLWMYILMALIGLMPVEEGPMMVVSVAYGALGMLVLFIYNYGTVFSGWNENSLAMIGFFSFCVMIVGFNRVRDFRVLICLLVYAAMYFVLLEVLNSRGSVLFAIVLLLGVFGILPFQRWFKNKRKILIIMLIPLLIAIFVVLIRNAGIVDKLESWSYETFNKPIFNGRDELWYQGFMDWMKHPVFGNGNLSAANWHNSAVTMLVGGGLVGYFVWLIKTRDILAYGCPWIRDGIVFGLIAGILGIWLQQTVELSLVANHANAIPYAMMGLLLGRVRTLEEKNSGM